MNRAPGGKPHDHLLAVSHRPAEGRSASFAALAARVRSPRAYATKDAAPRWAAAEFRDGYRDLAHFVRAHAIVLDLDAGATCEQIAEAFADDYVLAHTTWTPGRWRVAIVLDRPVTLRDDEFGRVQRACFAHAERHGLAPEVGQSAAHCFALPCLGGAPYEYIEIGGALFDVDAALATFPKPAPLPIPERRDATDSYGRRLERARKYLERMPGAISGLGGHVTTFAAALKMVRGFGLDPDDAFRLLAEVHNPLCAPAWSERELRHKVKQADQRGRLPHGFLADRGRAA